MSMHTGELETIHEHVIRFRAVTMQSLGRTPLDKLAWSPSPHLMTFSGMYAHIAKIERLYISGLSGRGWNPTPNLLDGPNTVDALRRMLADSHAEMLGWIDSLAPSDLDVIVNVPWLPVKWPLRSWLWYLVEHELHHKGQLATYLHLCGIVAPFFAFAMPPGVRPDKRPLGAWSNPKNHAP
jgi:uncharacterized damage-inducible protein DinB